MNTHVDTHTYMHLL